LNPQPLVLETSALPIELHPFGNKAWPMAGQRSLARPVHPAQTFCRSFWVTSRATFFRVTPMPLSAPCRVENRSLHKDLGDDAGTDGLTTFADSKAEVLFHRDRLLQFDSQLDVVAGHAHFGPALKDG
jgi:hypothetical protein